MSSNPKFLKVQKLLIYPCLLLLIACSGTEEKSKRPTTPRKKKASRIIAPKNNTTYSLGDIIDFRVGLSEDSANIDSIKLEAPNVTETFTGSTFSWTSTNSRVGKPRLKLTVYFQGKKETLYPKVTILPGPPVQYTYRVINTYPHDDEAYTQGLFWHDSDLWESTGKPGASTMRKVELTTGKPVQMIDLDAQLFGEGAAIYQDQIYQLTYHAQKGFVYNLDLQLQREFRFSTETTEGWGLTHLDENLVVSDGSENLYVMEPDGFTEIDRIQVYDHNGLVINLNELENIEGRIYANVYGENYIVVIDPKSGAVVEEIDLTAIWPANPGDIDHVLNGIAFDPDTKRMFVTGKYWPNLYEVQTLRRANQP